MEKAINNTTVEVTFADAVDNIEALDFTIEGLEVKNAVTKQTDKKTVVLTTAAQTAGTEYTVAVNKNAVGKFVGISAVIPTAIKLTTPSVQGVLGQQVTVKAEVTVAEGQSKAGIPVTFNVPAQGSLANAITTEATTNAEGVATYTYTRYTAVTDDVVAYATGDRTKFSAGKVYWATASQLTITEKTEGNLLSNGAKKVFEINAPSKAGKYVFVTFTNNVGVTTDKLTRSVFAEGTGLWEQTGSSINVMGSVTGQFPYEITNGANRVVPVLLDSKGKANLVLSGTNGKVTPVVYDGVLKTAGLSSNPGSVVGDFANILYNPTALQDKAAEVSFEIKHTLGLTVEAKGVSNAAVALTGTQTGGRDYTATYVDKDGKPAKAGDIVNVAIQNNASSTTNAFLVDEDGNELAYTTERGYKYYAVAVKGTEGKVNFTVASYNEEAFAAPIVFVNNGTGPDAYKSFLDASDLQAQAESVYFTKAVQYTAELVALDKNGDETKSVRAGGDEFVEYSYNLLDQNGKPRAYTAAATNVTFNFTAGTNAINTGDKTITPGNPGSVTRSIIAGDLSTSVFVTSAQAGSVTGFATASHVGAAALPSTDAVTVQFTSVSTLVTRGTLDATIAATGTTITIEGVPYSLSGATYLNNGTVVPTLAAFRAYLVAGATVDVTKDADGNLVFNVVPASSSSTLFGTYEDIKAGLLLSPALKSALQSFTGFSALTNADQNTVVTNVLAAAAYADATALEAGVTQEVFNIYKANLLTLTAAPATTYADVVAFVGKIPGASAAVTALNGVTNTTIQAAIITDLQTISATTAATLVTEINTAISTANSAPAATALANINAGFIKAATAATAAELSAANTVLNTNAAASGINLAGYTALTPAQKDATLNSLLVVGAGPAVYTAASLQAALNNAIALATDATAPTITTAKFDAAAETLTVTFGESVNLSATDTGTIDFKNVALPGSVAFTAVAVGANDKELVFTLTTPALDAFAAGSVIETITLSAETIKDNAIPTANGATLTGLTITVQ